MTTPDTTTNRATTEICYGSGVADPDFFFPTAGDTASTSYRDRVSALPGKLLRLIRH